MSEEIEMMDNPLAETAAIRSVIYQIFAATWEYPDKEILEEIRSGLIADRLKEVLTLADPKIVEGVNWDALRDAGADDDTLQIEFTRLFDVGSSGPPCTLYGGEYTGARMQIMEELVRFYNFFSLSMAEDPHELPDHLVTQLEFLHFLTYRESELAKVGEETDDMKRAERDFLARHPGRWLPEMFKKLEEQNPMPFYHELTCLMLKFVQIELARLVGLVGEAPDDRESQVVKIVG